MTAYLNGIKVKVLHTSVGYTLIQFTDGDTDLVKDELLVYTKEEKANG